MLMASRRSGDTWLQAVELSLLLGSLMVLVTCLDWLLPADLRVFGILPRTLHGLVGILFAPLLHLGFGHLMANLLPLVTLLILLLAERRYEPIPTLGLLWIGSG